MKRYLSGLLFCVLIGASAHEHLKAEKINWKEKQAFAFGSGPSPQSMGNAGRFGVSHDDA